MVHWAILLSDFGILRDIMSEFGTVEDITVIVWNSRPHYYRIVVQCAILLSERDRVGNITVRVW